MLADQDLAFPLKAPDYPDHKVNILMVDDQPESLLAIEAVLENLGQNLVKASSGQEALWRLLHEDFAVILLDVKMPAMDGFEVAAMVRERERSRHTPIIFMTAAQRSEAEMFKGYEVGAVDYILKPIVPEILRSKVAVFVELAKKTEMIKSQAELLLQAELREREKQIEDALAFSHAVSHDLRTPLRHIESFSEILVRTYSDRLDERGRDFLRRMAGAAQKMTRLIDAMLELSEATRGDISDEIVDLSKLAANLASEFHRADPERRVELSIEDGLSVRGDPQLLRLAVENLLKNAWKYTRRKTSARIEFGKIEVNGSPVYFVRDDGVGFDMNQSDKLFLPFSRLHARGDFEGTGIGLATVARIIRRHGGRIWGEGHVDQGATFFFTLPAPETKTR